MLISLIFLLILIASSVLLREKKAGLGRTRALQTDPVPHVFVQPARSDSVRRFFDGKASILNLQEDGSLMIVENQKSQSRDTGCYLLKSKEAYNFQSTILSQDPNGRISVHASLRESRKQIVFRTEN